MFFNKKNRDTIISENDGGSERIKNKIISEYSSSIVQTYNNGKSSCKIIIDWSDNYNGHDEDIIIYWKYHYEEYQIETGSYNDFINRKEFYNLIKEMLVDVLHKGGFNNPKENIKEARFSVNYEKHAVLEVVWA
jgi:hypothetical protein